MKNLYEFYCPVCEHRGLFVDRHGWELGRAEHLGSGTHSARMVTHEAVEYVRGLAALYERFYA